MCDVFINLNTNKMYKVIIIDIEDKASIALFEYIEDNTTLTQIEISLLIRNVPSVVVSDVSGSFARHMKKQLIDLGCTVHISEKQFVITGQLREEFKDALNDSFNKDIMDDIISRNEDFKELLKKDEDSIMLYQDKYGINATTDEILDFFPDEEE